MPHVLAKYLFSKLLVSPRLRASMEALYAISGMDVLLLDSLGVIRLAVPRQPSLGFVQLLRASPETDRRLREVRQAGLTGQVVDVLGFHEIVYEIPAEQVIAGYLVLSGYRRELEDVDLQSTRELWRRLVRAGLPVRWTDWFRTWSALPALSKGQQTAWRDTMSLHVRQVLQRLEKAESTAETAWPSLVRQASERIQAEFEMPLRMKAVASDLGVCPEHLSRVFHQATGMRFAEYLAETRINAACEALVQSTDPIAQIAHRCGFSTISRFNRCFRKHRDTTPRAWRNRAQYQAG